MRDTDKEREKRKKQLRQGMTAAPETSKKPEPDELDKKLRRHRAVRLLILLLAAVVAVGAFVLLEMNRRKEIYDGHVISWEKEITTTGNDRYIAYMDYILRWNRDGITYVNSKGEAVWTQSFELSDPVAVVNGSYAAVIDRGGYLLYIFNESGCTGKVSTLLPIHKVTVSAGGVTAIVVEDDLADKVFFYDMSGRQMGIEMKTLLTEDGYTLDMSLSPDGQQMVAAYVYLDQGVMKNQVVFRNFGDEGQEMIKRLVGGFKEYDGQLIGRTVFLDDVYACAFAQDRVCFYSLKNRLSPQLVKQIDYGEEICSVFYSTEYVGVISEGSDSAKRQISVYDRTGKVLAEFETAFAYTGANFSGGRIVLYNTSYCEIYNLYGDLKYEAAVGSDIRWLACTAEDMLLIIDGKTAREIKLESANTWDDLLGR
ncbi:MAG: hypothetical protein IJZ85_03505 [Lachnospiraceae bacterium]|nr:hypothetical protein [Lachnospiraceae bacterium]